VNNNVSPSPHPAICPICRSENDFTSTEVRIAERVIYVCEECLGYFLFPPMYVEYLDSKWSKSRKEKWENDIQVGHKFAPRICKRAEYYLGRPVQSILEIGCGSGFMGEGFNSFSCDYTGIDIDSKSIEFAQSRGIDAYCLSVENAGKDTLPRSEYDLIISSNVFEHLDNPYTAFQSLRKICGGIIITIVPNAKGLFALLKTNKSMQKLIQLVSGYKRENAYSIDGYWHNIGYSLETFRCLCEKTGLEPLKIAPMGKNDRVFGFVQRNSSFKYKLAEGIAGLLGMDNEIISIATLKSF